MEIGTVTGSVWATRSPGAGRPHPSAVRTGTGKTVAADFVGAGAGDRVLLVCGSTARLYCPESPVDTAIVAILDQMEVDHVST
ncbi:MAG: EutN/CcmL family microcompartment protein [Oscillospiraceae bacterium]